MNPRTENRPPEHDYLEHMTARYIKVSGKHPDLI